MTATDRARRQSTTDHAGRAKRIEAVRSAVEASYTATHHLAIYVETQMPPITRSPDG